ncbi:MAG: hypothetical protein B6D61_13060, partial [Bacteroidetes bacterium 4484_249]
MNLRRIYFLWTFFILFLYQQSNLFADNREFTYLTIENGLSQSTIFKVIQDTKGYLWITTQDGLDRYDGYTFKVFRHSIIDTQSISDNSLTQLIQDKNGDIWVSSIHGNINQYHYKTGKFSSYQLNDLDSTLEDANLSSMALDSSGFLWFGMEGAIGKLNTLDKKISIYHKYSSKKIMNIPYIYIDKKNNIWVGDKEGLYLFNNTKNEFELFEQDVINRPLVKNIITICEDNSGNLWLGVSGHAPLRFTPQNKAVLKYDNYFSAEAIQSFDNLTSVLFTTTNELIIGTLNNGLFILHPQSGTVEHLLNNSLSRKSLSFNHVLSLYEDRAQNLWIGTLKGLNKLNLKPKKFEIFRLSNSTSLIDKNHAILTIPNVIISVFKDSGRRIWLGTYTTGLYTIDEKTNKIKRFDSIP